MTSLRSDSKEVVAPLSALQRGIFLAHQLEPQSPAYNMCVAAQVHAPLRIPELERALAVLADRHPLLRASFEVLPSGPVQRIPAQRPLPYRVHDTEHLDEPALKARMLEALRRPYRLDQDPPYRLDVFRRPGDRFAVLQGMHHVASDMNAMAVLLEELGQLYVDTSAVSALKEPGSYLGFSRELTGKTQGESGEALLAYWRTRLEGSQPLNLPWDRVRTAAPLLQGGMVSFSVPGSVTAPLDALAKKVTASPFAVWMAAFQIFLNKWTGQQDVVVNSPVTLRSGRDHARTVGLFVNTLAIRGGVRPAETFTQHVDSMQRSLFRDLHHRSLPMAELFAQLHPGQTPATTPLLQVQFSMQSARADFGQAQVAFFAGSPGARLTPGGLELETISLPQQEGQFDLALDVFPLEGRVHCELRYDSALFDPGTAERMASGFQALIHQLAATPERAVGSFSALPPEDSQAFEAWNRTEHAYPLTTYAEVFDAQVQRTPDAIAVREGETALTYRALDAATNRWGRSLAARGAGPDRIVAILAPRGVPFLTGIIGTLKAGAAYLPLDPNNPPARLAQVLQQAGPVLVLASEGLLATAREAIALTAGACTATVELLGADPEEDAGPLAPRAHPGSAAYVIFTSGSTGVPKGTVLDHRGLLNHALALADFLPLGPGSAVAQTASQCFDISVWQFLTAPLTGGRTEILPDEISRDPVQLLQAVETRGVTVLQIVPALWRAVLEELEGRDRLPALAQLRWMIPTGEAVPPDLCRRWRKLYAHVEMLNAYGPAECSDDVTLHRVESLDLEVLPIGKPIANLKAYVTDPTGQRVPRGVRGELCFGGVGVGRGYLNDPVKTAQAFVPDPFSGEPGARLYRTGDIGRFLPDGSLEFSGRADHQVKIRGFRIELGEIEAALLAQPGVRSGVVMAREDSPGERRLVAYLVADGQDSAALRGALLQRLPDYMVPAAFVFLDALPLSPNGKVDRKALPAPSIAPVGAYVAPRDEVEATLAEIWQRVLGGARVGAHDNLFELGGDSILAIQIVAQAARAGLKVTARQIFQHPTVAQLAKVAERRTLSGPRSPRMQPGRVELSLAQREFFQQGFAAPAHYNQAELIRIPETVTAEVLAAALHGVARHHPAFGLRFTGGEAASATYEAGRAEWPLTVVPLTGLPAAQWQARMEEVAEQVHATLDPQAGPLGRAVLFDLGGERRLFLTLHHLIVDGVSWRILLEDLELACEQLSRGAPLELPAGTATLSEFGDALVRAADAPGAREEAAFWRQTLAGGVAALPVDFPGGQNREADTRFVSVSLSEEETRALLQDLPRLYQSGANDVLLSALARSLTAWTGASEHLVDLEGHGREDVFGELDLSRTVGWFTTTYPVRLRAPLEEGPVETLRATKTALRQIPAQGARFGLLAQLGAPELREALRGPRRQICFNFLGRMDSPSASGFAMAPESRGPVVGLGHPFAPANDRPYALELLGSVTGGRLTFLWGYSTALHREETITAAAEGFLENLRALLREARSGARAYVPSDFPLVQVSPRLLSELQDVEDVLPLLPLQQGILFQTLLNPGESLYLVQFSVEIEGALEPRAFEEAWRALLQRHPAARSSFAWLGEAAPLQVVRRTALPSWQFEDWSAEPDPSAREQELLRADRAAFFDLREGPMIRGRLVKRGPDRHLMLWTYHHLIIDGWSLSVLIRDFLALLTGRPLEPRTLPLRDYPAWLKTRDLPRAAAFWREQLREVRPLTLAPARRGTATPSQSVWLPLDARLTAAAAPFCRTHRITLNTLVQAAWALVLAHETGKRDVVFGTPVAGRPAELDGIDHTVGVFLNTVPVRVRLDAAETVPQLLSRLHQTQADANEHEHLGLAGIYEHSGLPTATELFDTLLVFQNYPIHEVLAASASGLKLDQVMIHERNELALTVKVIPGDPWRIMVDHPPDRVSRERTEALIAQLGELIHRMTTGPSSTVGELLETPPAPETLSDEQVDAMLRSMLQT